MISNVFICLSPFFALISQSRRSEVKVGGRSALNRENKVPRRETSWNCERFLVYGSLVCSSLPFPSVSPHIRRFVHSRKESLLVFISPYAISDLILFTRVLIPPGELTIFILSYFNTSILQLPNLFSQK